MLKNLRKSNMAHALARPQLLVFLLALVLIVVGYLLMMGQGSGPASFCPDIFSLRRIVVAPLLCFAGYVLVGVSIVLYRP